MFGEFNHPSSAHTLRHTFAIQRINAGVAVKVVADWLGDDPKTIMDYYAHAIHSTREMQEDVGREAMQAIEAKMKLA